MKTFYHRLISGVPADQKHSFGLCETCAPGSTALLSDPCSSLPSGVGVTWRISDPCAKGQERRVQMVQMQPRSRKASSGADRGERLQRQVLPAGRIHLFWLGAVFPVLTTVSLRCVVCVKLQVLQRGKRV